MRILYLFVCSLMIAGCATVESLDQVYDQIRWEDGINRNEAAIIAKRWVSDSKYAGDFQLFGPTSAKHEQEWQITFLYKSLDYYEKVLDVFIDPKTGEVKGTVIRHRNTPDVFQEKES